LVKKNFTIEVVEIDTESVSYLKKNYPQLVNKITEGDFLEINLKEKYPYSFSLIGNFPYNISSQILFKALENKNQISEIIGMFQKEVAERIACKKGKKRGVLSVFLQAFYDIEYCFTVHEDVFTPPPKIKSGVIKLVRNSRKELPCDQKKFQLVVKTSFNQKRKTLRNALKSFTLKNESKLQDLLNLRAEQLSVDDFIRLTTHIR
jgi:16S rRNA (adenine1518-N6/adenine1519-N6)-dimethyltransferase